MRHSGEVGDGRLNMSPRRALWKLSMVMKVYMISYRHHYGTSEATWSGNLYHDLRYRFKDTIRDFESKEMEQV